MTDVQVTPLHPSLGAEVSGVDLNAPLDAPTREALGRALAEHLVLVFRDQSFTPEQYLAAASAAFAAAFVLLGAVIAGAVYLFGCLWLLNRPRPLLNAAVSVGVVDGEPRLDLCYEEDVSADTDMNVVCTGDGNFVEVQGTAEGEPFDRSTLDILLSLAAQGCAELSALQQAALSS